MPQRIDWTLLPANALIRQRELLQVLPFSSATLWRRVRNHTFPQPIRVSEHMTAWRLGEVNEWLNAHSGTELKGKGA